MTTKFTLNRTVLAGVALVVSMAAMTGITSAAPFKRMPAQAPTCGWTKLPGQSSQPTFHAASAYDTKNNHMYVLGGISRDNTTQSSVNRINVSDPDPSKATQGSAGTIQQRRYGAAAAYWPASDASSEGKIIVIGGADTDGDGDNGVQVYDVKTGSTTSASPSGGQQRVFHMAAYDPDHKVIVVHGGTKVCKLVGRTKPTPAPTATPFVAFGLEVTQQSEACTGDSLGTQFLKIDDATGAMTWMSGPSGGPSQLFGSTMAYDSDKKRMIAFGGVQDEAKNPVKTLFQLDLSNPDITKAAWSPMSVSGGPSARAFAASAYDANMKAFIVYGGGTTGFFNGAKENVQDDTWALSFMGAAPAWIDLKSSAGDRLGGVMAYAPNHMKVIVAAGRSQYKDTGSQTVANDARVLGCVVTVPTAVPTRATGVASVTPGGTVNTPMPVATPTLVVGQVCESIKSRVPAAVINAALASPDRVYGWNMAANPSLPPSRYNPLRAWLSLNNNAVPWSPANNVVFKAGCN